MLHITESYHPKKVYRQSDIDTRPITLIVFITKSIVVLLLVSGEIDHFDRVSHKMYQMAASLC